MWCDNKDCCYNMGCGQCDIEYLISFDGEGRCEGICIVEEDDREETKNRLSPKKKRDFQGQRNKSVAMT